MQEYKEAARQKTNETGITMIPNEDSLFTWRAILKVRIVSVVDFVFVCKHAASWYHAKRTTTSAGSTGHTI